MKNVTHVFLHPLIKGFDKRSILLSHLKHPSVQFQQPILPRIKTRVIQSFPATQRRVISITSRGSCEIRWVIAFGTKISVYEK